MTTLTVALFQDGDFKRLLVHDQQRVYGGLLAYIDDVFASLEEAGLAVYDQGSDAFECNHDLLENYQELSQEEQAACSFADYIGDYLMQVWLMVGDGVVISTAYVDVQE